MALWNNFPYSNVHELNLDWIIEKMKYLIDQWESYGTEVDADAVAGLVPNVTVDGDLKSGLTFHFTLVQGPQGEEGPQGVSVTSATMDAQYQLTLYFSDGTTWTSPSLKGDQGNGLQILDEYATLADLQTAHPTGQPGDAYLVGVSPSFTLYIWSASSAAWVDGGALTNPSPTITTPLMDGTADYGTEMAYARGDHRHPSDTSKQDVLTAGTDISIDATNTISFSGTIPSASNNTPSMDGNADAGSSASFSRSDHVHPSDTSKQDTLVSSTNIKTINGQSLLGSGDLSAGSFGIDVNDILYQEIETGRGNTNTDLNFSYTATQDCWIIFSCVKNITMAVDGHTIRTMLSNGSEGTSMTMLAASTPLCYPIKTGQVVTLSNTAQPYNNYRVYIYAAL